MDSNISNLPLGPSIVGTEVLPADNSTETAQYSFNSLKTFVLGAGLSAILAVGNTTGSTTIVFSQGTANTVAVLNGSKQLVSSIVTNTELGYLSSATGNIQSQIDSLNATVAVLNTGIYWKEPVKAATTGNLTVLSGLLTVDGVSLVANDRVLVKNQTSAELNGIYSVKSGAWTRATDFATGGKLAGARVSVNEGSTNADKLFNCTNDDPITLGVDAIVFVESGGTSYSGTSNRITVSGGVIDIASTYVGQNSITTLGTVSTGVWQGTAIGTGYTEAKMKGSVGAAGYIAYSNGVDSLTGNSKFEYYITGSYSYARLTSPNTANHTMLTVANTASSLEAVEAIIVKGRDVSLEATTGIVEIAAGGSATPQITVKSTGVINLTGVPTSSAGLSAGDLWSNGGVLTIV